MLLPLLLALQVGACTDCVIRAQRVVTLGDTAGPGTVSQPTGLARTAAGNWVLTHAADPGRVTLFSSAGKVIRAVGRHGSGPGEYRFASLATAGPGDSIWIFDNSLRRVSVLDSNLQYGRSFPVQLPAMIDVHVLPDRRMVFDAAIVTEERAGFPLHLVGSDGRIIRSFGSEKPVFRMDRQALSRRAAWPAAASGRFWVADIVRYRIQQWDLSGKKVSEFNRDVKWFPPQEDFWQPKDAASAPHPPGLVSIHEDSTGTLWTLIRVPDAEWRSALGERTNLLGKKVLGVVDASRYQDTVVEALDPRTGRAIASARMDGVLYRFVDERMALEYREDETGNPTIVVWQFHLSQKDGSVSTSR